MFPVKVSMIIASHLSDAQHELGSNNTSLALRAQHRISFVKWLVHFFPDTNQYIDDIDAEYAKFCEKYPEQFMYKVTFNTPAGKEEHIHIKAVNDVAAAKTVADMMPTVSAISAQEVTY